MSRDRKVIDFNEASERLRKRRNVKGRESASGGALTRVEPRSVVKLEQIEEMLRAHPELSVLREKGVESHHIAAWLQTFPAVKLEELVGILELAVRKMKSGESERILDYLFQPVYPDWKNPDTPKSGE